MPDHVNNSTIQEAETNLSHALDHALGILPACEACGRTTPHYHTRDGHVIFGRWGYEVEEV